MEQVKDKVSIIIPIHNNDDYLEKCFKSIQSQTYSNLEVILINDGSTDNSRQICEKWLKQDKRFILFNNINNGVSYSRNFGIEKSSGDYIVFVDCDDFIEKEMIEVLVNKIDKFDYVMINYNKYYNEKRVVKNFEVKDKEYNRKEFLENFWDLYNSNMINSPCNKIFKSPVLKKNRIRFDLKYDLGEDLLFNLEYINRCETFCTINQYLYNYRCTTNSLTTKYRENYLETQLFLNNSIKRFFIQNNCYEEKQQREIQKNIADIIISSIQKLFLESSSLKLHQIRRVLKRYLSIPEIINLKKVHYSEKRLEVFKNMIVKRKVNLIIIYSKTKEMVRKFIKNQG